MNNINTLATHIISDENNFGFSAKEYSKFKYGSSEIGDKFGNDLFNRLINLRNREICSYKKIYVFSSPYDYIPTATNTIFTSFLDKLSKYLDGKCVVEMRKINRNTTYTEDYGSLSKEDRLNLISNDTFDIKNDFVIDFATLTGAARVALGTELPALFTNDTNLGKMIIKEGKDQIDPMWELPLFTPYERFLENKYDALSSTGTAGTGGAITAALFLKKFVNVDTNWAHIDLMAWNTSGRPGFPAGGEAMGLRNIVNMIVKYCNQK